MFTYDTHVAMATDRQAALLAEAERLRHVKLARSGAEPPAPRRWVLFRRAARTIDLRDLPAQPAASSERPPSPVALGLSGQASDAFGG